VDCEQFDRVALDLLYDEAEDYARGGAVQHLAHCSRCNGVYVRLKAAQALSQFPLAVPPTELRDQILMREHTARAGQGIGARMGRWISIAAGYAMRPQVSMGALFLLMIGASLLFLRAHPGDRDSVYVTEKGVPGNESDVATSTRLSHGTPPPAPENAQGALQVHGAASTAEIAVEPPTTGVSDATFSDGEHAFNQNHFREATELFDKLASAGGPRASEASLRAAQSDLRGRGCAAAVERFDRIYAEAPLSVSGRIAAWEAGNCYSQTGHKERAREYFQSLTKDPLYSERAQRSLVALEQVPSAPRRAADDASSPEPAATHTP